MISAKKLLDHTNLFSPNDYKMNDKVIYKYFKDKYVKRKCFCYMLKENCSAISGCVSISAFASLAGSCRY